MQPVRFESPEEFEAHRVAVNERLLLFGYRGREDGKVARVPAAATLSEAQQRADALRAELARRDVHPDVLHFCRAELLQHNYFHAVLEAFKSVAEKLRDLSGLQGDGAELVDAACSLSSGPIVAFNALSTEWERSEQTGLATLLKGLFGTFRNPTAHALRSASPASSSRRPSWRQRKRSARNYSPGRRGTLHPFSTWAHRLGPSAISTSACAAAAETVDVHDATISASCAPRLRWMTTSRR